ncbi:ComEA family DNA-binding protein [Pseudomonas oryzihabitans]|uniref:ComEA family DNA-binding protein n=1 Tax=Pseudomonas oryzihabitans TaxID=47885 RepID=UPI00285BAC75|nr:helix-hairpin-helix domain-containing protein [Pseudomonas psychrotolerans]MDR6680073.1 competence protein ComEA [Pseudomonas psychrotolerans]
MRLLWTVLVWVVLSSWALGCETVAGVTTTTSTDAPQVPLNINVADVVALQRLQGIGAAKAQAIVDYRQSHGAFASVDELLEVKGIGKKLLQRNRASLSVD